MDSNARKNIIYSLVLLLLVLLVYLYRSRNGGPGQAYLEKPILVNFSGELLGQPYLILYHSQQSIEKSSVDSVLAGISGKLSATTPSSGLYRINLADTLLNPTGELVDLLRAVIKASENSASAWDPTAAPLNQIWNFSSLGPKLQDSVKVSDVLAKVGVNKLLVSDSLILKTSPGLRLDLTDYGQALAVDQLALFFEKKGVVNFLIQAGRHTLARGLNEKQELWKAKISYPLDTSGTGGEGRVALQDRAISSSGDFSSFYWQDSLRKPFRLDPRTGYPVNHGLLGVSVLAKDTRTAALFSETLMVQGWREGMRLDSARSDLEIILIFNEIGSGIRIYASPELRSYLSFPLK